MSAIEARRSRFGEGCEARMMKTSHWVALGLHRSAAVARRPLRSVMLISHTVFAGYPDAFVNPFSLRFGACPLQADAAAPMA